MTPTREAVATMEGRELDAAVCERLFGIPRRMVRVCGSTEEVEVQTANKAVRKKGWTVEMIENLSPEESDWLVRFTFCHGGQHSQREAVGDTLPLALARAALLTTCTPNPGE